MQDIAMGCHPYGSGNHWTSLMGCKFRTKDNPGHWPMGHYPSRNILTDIRWVRTHTHVLKCMGLKRTFSDMNLAFRWHRYFTVEALPFSKRCIFFADFLKKKMCMFDDEHLVIFLAIFLEQKCACLKKPQFLPIV